MKKLINNYVSKLNASLQDFQTTAFNDLIVELESCQAKLVTELAHTWTKETKSKVNSKKKALVAIKSRREWLEIGRAKNISTGENIAA